AQADPGDVQSAQGHVLHQVAPFLLLSGFQVTPGRRRGEVAARGRTDSPPLVPGTAPSLEAWTTATRSGPSSAPAGPRSLPSRPGWRTTAATAGCPACAAARSPTWPGSASSTTPNSNGATYPEHPRACSTRSAGPFSSARPSGNTCSISPAPLAPRAAPAAGPRPGRSGPASPASWTG